MKGEAEEMSVSIGIDIGGTKCAYHALCAALEAELFGEEEQ